MMKTLRCAFLVCSLILTVTQEAFCQWRGYEWGPGPGRMGGGYGMSWFWGILWFALWFAVMVLLFLLIRYLAALIKAKQDTGKSYESALDILKKRYAKGELNKEEYEQKKKDLSI
jgi:putative membrane protein